MTDHLLERSLVRLRERVDKTLGSTGELFRKLFRNALRNRRVLLFWLQVGLLIFKLVKFILRMFHAA